MNKLQLVDAGKLNAVLELIKKRDNETKKILDTIKNPDNFTIEEKKNEMEKVNKQQSENIVEFVKNKNYIKRKFDEKEDEKKKKKKKEKTPQLVQDYKNIIPPN